jgi:hypothetical protein
LWTHAPSYHITMKMATSNLNTEWQRSIEDCLNHICTFLDVVTSELTAKDPSFLDPNRVYMPSKHSSYYDSLFPPSLEQPPAQNVFY